MSSLEPTFCFTVSKSLRVQKPSDPARFDNCGFTVSKSLRVQKPLLKFDVMAQGFTVSKSLRVQKLSFSG